MMISVRLERYSDHYSKQVLQHRPLSPQTERHSGWVVGAETAIPTRDGYRLGQVSGLKLQQKAFGVPIQQSGSREQPNRSEISARDSTEASPAVGLTAFLCTQSNLVLIKTFRVTGICSMAKI